MHPRASRARGARQLLRRVLTRSMRQMRGRQRIWCISLMIVFWPLAINFSERVQLLLDVIRKRVLTCHVEPSLRNWNVSKSLATRVIGAPSIRSTVLKVVRSRVTRGETLVEGG